MKVYQRGQSLYLHISLNSFLEQNRNIQYWKYNCIYTTALTAAAKFLRLVAKKKKKGQKRGSKVTCCDTAEELEEAATSVELHHAVNAWRWQAMGNTQVMWVFYNIQASVKVVPMAKIWSKLLDKDPLRFQRTVLGPAPSHPPFPATVILKRRRSVSLGED